MASISFSAIVSAASGKIGDIVCSRWKGIPYVRRRVIPANPRSGKQVKQRYCLTMALVLWQSIKSWAKTPWTLAVSGYSESGYNRFMDMCIAALRPQFTEGGAGVDPTLTAPAVTVGTPFNASYAALIAVQAAVPTTQKLTVTWTQRAGVGSNNKVLALHRLDHAHAWTAQADVLESAQTVDITGLTNTEQYEVALVPHDITSGLYGESSHQLATPHA